MRYSKLLINGERLLPGSDFDVSFSIAPIGQAANMRRTVNGQMINLARSVYRKYAISISGNGRRSPAFSDADAWR